MTPTPDSLSIWTNSNRIKYTKCPPEYRISRPVAICHSVDSAVLAATHEGDKKVFPSGLKVTINEQVVAQN
jgi:hypothetical protein